MSLNQIASETTQAVSENTSLWQLVISGGFTMIPLVICSLLLWVVIIERIWVNRKLKPKLLAFHLEACNALLKRDFGHLRTLCEDHKRLPTARLLTIGLDRITQISETSAHVPWSRAVHQRRQLINQELKNNLWILGTIASAAPFIGLFGTVVGILRSFHAMAQAGGTSGFNVVAAGISEALIATAVGIIVAVIAVIAYNALLTWVVDVTLLIRLQTEEMIELLGSIVESKKSQAP